MFLGSWTDLSGVVSSLHSGKVLQCKVQLALLLGREETAVNAVWPGRLNRKNKIIVLITC